MIERLRILNYKVFRDFELKCNEGLNIVVGNNETGKSTILEAINLALTGRLNGRAIDSELTPHLFNKEIAGEFIAALHENKNPAMPRIVIELYLSDKDELQALRGNNNSERLDSPGVKVEIEFSEDYKDEYSELLKDRSKIQLIPTEYYRAHWYSFADHAITARSLPAGVSYIDATTIRLQSGTDYYLNNIINSGLDVKERTALAVAYRRLKEEFSGQSSIKQINDKLTQKKGAITNKDLAIGLDVSQKTSWEANLVPHLDELPFQFIGKGEQNALKIMLALDRKAEESNVILIEEPENHLSFSSMNVLISKIREKCEGKQIFITTHSAFVLNKLGVASVVLISNSGVAFLQSLSKDTQDYFKKLPGYDTLRMMLARRSILVEGPSDELIVQKAYLAKHGRLPIEDGVDVISVRGLSFKRFLEIAQQLKLDVRVVTDNDGNYEQKVAKKYKDFEADANIKICANKDNAHRSLEQNMVATNGKELLNRILGTTYTADDELSDFMEDNKTEVALRIFECDETVKYPEYVEASL